MLSRHAKSHVRNAQTTPIANTVSISTVPTEIVSPSSERLKWSRRRKWKRGEVVLNDVYVSINSGKTYWITGKMCRTRKITKWFWWQNWTVHIGGEVVGTWPILLEAKHETQLYHDRKCNGH